MNGLYEMPQMPYKIAEYLVNNADENFWKALYYKDIDALSHDALTLEQKTELIWTTQPQEECNIFFTRMIREAIPEEKAIIKIFNGSMAPVRSVSPYNTAVIWCIEFLWGGNLAIIYDENGLPCNRGDILMRYFMSCINGKYIGGVGTISFDSNINRYVSAGSVMGNSKTYTGYNINLPVVIGSDNTECKC